MAAQRVLPNYPKLVVILVFGAVVYNEFAVFFSATLRWPSFPDADETLRILFVADPQLQGIQHEHPFPVGALATWDSDRYLGKSFSWAVSAYDPQIVVFLGDLLDEGGFFPLTITFLSFWVTESEIWMFWFPIQVARATMRPFARMSTVSRPFMTSGPVSYQSSRPVTVTAQVTDRKREPSSFLCVLVKTSVYVAGDNDIGGDGGDPVTAEKMARFRDYFPSKPYYMFRGTSGVDISSSDEGIRFDPEESV